MPTRGQMGMPHCREDWEAAGLSGSPETREEDLPLNWGPGTENSAGRPMDGVSKNHPTEDEWEKSSVRGFTIDGKECRVLPWYGNLRFVERVDVGMFSYVGEMAFADFPILAEGARMGHRVSFRVRDVVTGQEVPLPPGKGEWVCVGKTDTHRGVTPAWVAECLGPTCVKVIRHCRVIKTSGEDVPLNGW